MYKLYYLPGACSLAIHALLNELNQPVEAIDRNKATDFDKLESRGMVPVLVDNGQVIREGAAIILYLLDKHKNQMLPESGLEKARFIEWVMFANATMHPAYGRLFFIGKTLDDGPAKEQALSAASDAINALWGAVDKQLQQSTFVCGDRITVVDMMLAVYASWGQYFPVDILMSDKVRRMIEAVKAHPAFIKAIEDQQSASQ
ncbi:glutathione S-transferase family protein [Pseudomonas sp. LPB0260]|uniref:glutathione S-transferase family protein n=1 Tax=unclassified Pseudomonas TaxID=196821 RepID=UPI0015C23609|nr:glutathione S-transferase family protein [Pseudomonas sp. LPB0260]QLC72654.1 glutathione S-transferase family protein [Pseudomonas sp. LPB0260]QLC75428.1 glutathione S-transferase family protein [Pseudomonas sp. LPB0260]